MAKLGDTQTSSDGQRWILTYRGPGGSVTNGIEVWTAIPAGEGPEGLGRSYRAASVVLVPQPPVERLDNWQD